MGGFLYFIPGVQAVNEKVLRDKGLGDRLSVFTSMQVQAGPGEKAGMLVRANVPESAASKERKTRFGYYPDEQEWSEVNGIWVGITKANPPGPEDLARDELESGYDVELNDGNTWHIPSARAFTKVLTVGPDGAIHAESLPKYEAFSRKAERLFALYYGCSSPEERDDLLKEISALDMFSLCVDAIAVNYRVGTAEVSLLKLLTTRNWWAVSRAVVDFEGFKKFADDMDSKKKRPVDSDGESTGCGETA